MKLKPTLALMHSKTSSDEVTFANLGIKSPFGGEATFNPGDWFELMELFN